MTSGSYHHGDLRRAVLDAAVDVITQSGPSAVSLRDLSRRVGVSHAGPTHHFGSKEGVFTALAAEGYALLADELGAAPSQSMADLGVAYVRFALAHPAHFGVMFRPDLFDTHDRAVAEAQERAWQPLQRSARAADTTADTVAPEVAELGAWALVHGIATLVATGAVGEHTADDVDRLVQGAAAMMFRAS